MAENGNTEYYEEEYTEYTDDVEPSLAQEFDESVAQNLDSLFQEGILAQEELDQRALDALKELDVESALAVLNELRTSDLQSVTNKSAYMCGLMKACRQKLAAGITSDLAVPSNKLGPSSTKMQELLDRTGYSHEVTMGQRKYGGPPPNWDGPQPGSGFEIFCGKIPPTIFEDTLIPMFEKCGTIWDLRLMMDPVTGNNKSFCFVTFTTRGAAQKAVKELDGFEIKPGKRLKVNISVANVRLFVGNIPKNKTKDELHAEFSKNVEGLADVIVYTNPDDPAKRNRGFAFLEFDSHKSAANARRRLGSLRIFGVEIVVNWAEPQDEPDEEIMSKVKILYVRNLKSDVTEEQVKEKFEPYGPLERVKKFKDYCFVHFEDRENALKAMQELNKKLLNSSEMLITLAKPPTANKQPKVPYQQQFGAGAWAPPVYAPVLRGRGRGLRPPVPMAAYGMAAAAYDPYGYAGYDYDYYGYEDADYYGSYGYPAPAPVVYAPVRPPRRPRAALPVRGLRPARVPMLRPAARGGIMPRGAGHPVRGVGQFARLGLRGQRGGRLLPIASRDHTQGLKRKATEAGFGMPETKRHAVAVDEWETQPIVQQPLGNTEDEWYQDTWG